MALVLSHLQAQNTIANGSVPELAVFAETGNQWTGIAISKHNRVFVNFPRWTKETPVSVAEIINGNIIPYPNTVWNSRGSQPVSAYKFICVQSVFIDELNTLWILDTGYELETDSTKEAHLYGFDLADNSLQKDYTFPAAIIGGKSYLNDFRIDNQKQMAYFTDSQLGGIVLLDLQTNEIRRVLSQHPSTLTEVSKIVIEGYERKHPVHSDGIELDSKKEYLYYCALMGENVYRIPTSALLNNHISDSLRGEQVEKFAKTGANDGIIFDKKGNLYLSSLERNAISKLNRDGLLEEVISNPEIKWPDSFAFDNMGNLFFTISQIHLPKGKRGSYKIFKLKLN